MCLSSQKNGELAHLQVSKDKNWELAHHSKQKPYVKLNKSIMNKWQLAQMELAHVSKHKEIVSAGTKSK